MACIVFVTGASYCLFMDMLFPGKCLRLTLIIIKIIKIKKI